MPQYFSPGVYIEEVENGPVPIQGVATSITGAVGVTLQGPTSGKPILVTSFNDFQTTFGGFLTPPPDSQLNQWLDPSEGGQWWQFPLSVKGYFDNGGQQLYVKRVFSSQAQAAAASLGQGLIADITYAAAATDTSLSLAHLFGIDKTTSLSIIVNGNPIAPPSTPPSPPSPPTQFSVTWFDPLSLEVGLSNPPGQALVADRDMVVISPIVPYTSLNPVGTTLKFCARAKGIWGNTIWVRVTPALGATLSILPDTVNGGPTFTGSVASATAMYTFSVLQGTVIAQGQTVIINNNIYKVGQVTQGSTGANATPPTFTVCASVSDGLQSLNSSTSAVISIPSSTVNASAAITAGTPTTGTTPTTTYTVSVPPGTVIAPGQTVVIGAFSYQVGTITQGSSTAAPPTQTTFTVTGKVSDSLNTLPPTTAITFPASNTTVTCNLMAGYSVTVTVPTGTVISPGETVTINNNNYLITGGGTPAAGTTAAAPQATFTINANIADGLLSVTNGTSVVILPASGTPTVNGTINSIVASAPGNVTVTLATAIPTGVKNVLIQGRIYPITLVTGKPLEFTITPDQLSYAVWPANAKVTSLRKARVTMVNKPNDTIDINNASQLYVNALVELDDGTDKKQFANVAAINDVSVTFTPPLTNFNNFYEGQKIRVLEATVETIQYAPDGSVAAQETFPNLRLSYDTSTAYLVNAVNQLSKLVNVEVNPAGLWPGWNASPPNKIFTSPSMFPCSGNGGWLQLANGTDALGALSVNDFVGVDGGPGNRTGIQALEDIDDVAICVVPGMWSGTITSALITFCENLKDRFAIIDAPDGLDIGGIQSFRAPYDTEYGALYYPWLVVQDPSTLQNADLAPSAHMAGIYAQTDNTRGVFKAPANVTVAGITISGPPNQPVGFAQAINQREQDILNPLGINALRYFPNRGYRVWGARTLSSDTTWMYINVRRIFIYVEKSIQVGTQWVVFEPNDEGTWSRVRQSVTNFLTTFWRQGGLQGTTAKEAFFVACDLGVTMTQDDIDNGRMIVQVGIAPVKPAEFVIFQVMQYTQTTTTS